MKIVKSPLIIERVVVLNSEYKTIFAPPGNTLNPDFENYPVDIDYSVKKTSNNSYRVFIKSAVNTSTENQMLGYSIFTEMMLEFSFNSSHKLTETEMKNYIFHSGLVMGINNIRNYIKLATSQMIFGHYLLPSIDLGELRKEKNRKTKKS